MSVTTNSNTQSQHPISRRRFIKRTLFGAGAVAACELFTHRYEVDALKVERHTITLRHSPNPKVITFGVLSDLHIDCERAAVRAERAVAMLMAQSPDAVILGGDLITYKPKRWAARAASIMANTAKAPLGAYSIIGNHDWWSGNPHLVCRELENVGIQVLMNRSVPLPVTNSMWLVGLNTRCTNAQQVEKALVGVPDNAVKLLLVHEPDYADEAPPGFALQISGHSHGGQICAPIYGSVHTPKYARKYISGLCQSPNHPLYVSRGVGVVGPQYRLFCPPEVTILELKV